MPPVQRNSTLLAELTASVGQKKQRRIGKMWLGVVLPSFFKILEGHLELNLQGMQRLRASVALSARNKGQRKHVLPNEHKWQTGNYG